jgi:hypothetical protein
MLWPGRISKEPHFSGHLVSHGHTQLEIVEVQINLEWSPPGVLDPGLSSTTSLAPFRVSAHHAGQSGKELP